MKFTKSAIAIVVSDIHLGNEFCRVKEFTEFLSDVLNNIMNENLRSLEVLIILGDFFDLLSTSFEDLCSNREYFQIYNLLDDLKNHDIEVVLCLGNHEVSTSLFYNLQFSERKERFVEEFDFLSFPFNFLTIDRVCQYFVLNSLDNEIYLSLIDSIYDDPFLTFNIGKGAFLNNETYFMCHGYQFEDKGLHHAITGIWDYTRGLTNDWKRFLTSLWSKAKEVFWSNDNVRYYDNIMNNLINLDDPYFYIVFGHTHKREIKDLRMINTGSWLKASDPSYLEIFPDGTSRLNEVSTKD